MDNSTREYKEYGLSDFVAGRKNILFITGYSASGKSTLAMKLCKKYNAEYVELDILRNTFIVSIPSQPKLFPKEIYTPEKLRFWVAFLRKYDLCKTVKFDNGDKVLYLTKKYMHMGEADRVSLLIDYLVSMPGRYIIEGVHIYIHPSLWEKIMKYPLIVMDVSATDARRSFTNRHKNTYDKSLGYRDKYRLSMYYKNQINLWNKFKSAIAKMHPQSM